MDLARFRIGWAAVAVAAAAACTASESEVRPDPDTIFFPTAVTVAPDDSVAFVVSANSDLTYDSGTVQVVDLSAVEQAVTAWKTNRTVPPDCAASVDQPETLACAEKDFLIDDAGVRIGNFATSVATQDLGGGKLRLMVPVRGDPSVTWMDWDPTTRRLGCSAGAGFALCDDEHRLIRVRDDAAVPLPSEPYGVFIDSVGEFAIVSHFSRGTISLIDSPAAGVPTVVDAASVGIEAGMSGVAGRNPGGDDLVYVQSRGNDRVFLLTVGRQAGRAPFIISGGFFFQNGIGAGASAGGIGEDSRGLVFRDGGDRAFFINRSPPALQQLDTSLDPTGVPRNRLIASTDICRKATSVTAADSGVGERAFVTCYETGELYVADPRGGGTVEATTLVGRGPISSAVAPSRRLLLVANFLDDSIAVVDIDPQSRFAHRVVLRIGGKS
ncbi:MAG: hypothetical protein IPL61_16875 [Myxococcales bacterium]|nr:hypothetical protein [Myxococcales bacterium]